MPGLWGFSYLEALRGPAKVHASVHKVPTVASEQKRDYIALATKCMERMRGRLKSAAFHGIHLKQCKHLVTKLESILDSLSRKPEHSEQCLEVLKLLYRLAVEVESFVSECCVGETQRELHGKKKHSADEDLTWHRTAITLANVSQRVSVLSYNLHFCTLVLRRSSIFEWSPSLTGLAIDKVSKQEVESLKENAKLDQKKLLEATDTLLSKNQMKMSEGYRLTKHLLARLTTTTALDSSPEQQQQQEKLYDHLKYGAFRTVQGKGKTLGEGANGAVKKGSWQGKDVALKQFSGVEKFPLFENEISILASLSHPSLVSVLGFATEHQEHIIILEFMNAGDLLKFMADRRKTRGCSPPFTIFEAVDIMLQIGSGVEYLHENKVMHRDLKSTNVLVKCLKAEDNVEFLFVKVADFEQSKMEGLSRTHLPMLKQKTRTTIVETTGTNRWMAPESIKDDNMAQPCKYDMYKSDVHSFGMVCYEILTGQVPFFEIENKINEVKKKSNWVNVLHGLLNVPRTLIQNCWHPIPSARPSFTEICVELRKVKFELMAGVKFEEHCLLELSKELVYLLEKNHDKMLLSKVPEEYNKKFGWNLSLPAYKVKKLLDLVQKMKGTLVVKDENGEKILHLVQNALSGVGNKNIKKHKQRRDNSS